MPTVNVFSTLPYPIQGDAYQKNDDKTKRSTKVGAYNINPGFNQVDADVWAIVKDLKQIQKRMDSGHIKADHTPTSSDWNQLSGTASRSYISDLSAKSGAIPNEVAIFGDKGSNKPERTIASLEAQIAKLDKMVSRLTGG